MAISYEKALRELLKYDIGRSAYFDVTIPSPTKLTNSATVKFSDVDTRIMSYLCHSAELPGEYTATVSQKIYGVVEKFPIMSGYEDITLSFYTYGLNIEEVRLTFMSWLSLITGRGDIVTGGKQTTYNVAYKSEFTSDIVITHYESTGKPILTCKLKEAYPIAIAQIPLAWSAENQAISFNVTFTYTEYEYDFVPATF